MIKGSDIPPPASKLASFPSINYFTAIINNSFVTSCQTSSVQTVSYRLLTNNRRHFIGVFEHMVCIQTNCI